MAEIMDQTGNSDVAMFIDWENMHGYIRGKANISALREVAESYGRLVLAKAYVDWRENRFQQDSLVLYKIGVEPIYVPHAPAGGKNNVDVKLATDCIDFAYRYPNVGVCILYPIRNSPSSPDVLFPSTKVIEPNDSFYYQEPRAVTYKLSIAVHVNSRDLSLADPKSLLAQSAIMAYDPEVLTGLSIQQITLDGVRALRIDDLPVGQPASPLRSLLSATI